MVVVNIVDFEFLLDTMLSMSQTLLLADDTEDAVEVMSKAR